MSFSSGKEGYNDISLSLAELSKNWNIDPLVKDLHLGKRHDVVDYVTKINQVTFHIPYLSDLSLYLVWGCLWPDCHNCCNRQGRLPLTSRDIYNVSKCLNYDKESSFLKNETYVASWNSFGTEKITDEPEIITTLTMINLKRKKDENENDNGEIIPCRFLNDKGACTLHPDKPGVCWLYPFYSWSVVENGHVSVHASYQLTGDCPGFSLSADVNDMTDCLNDYSKKIYTYSMQTNTTLREGYGRIDFNK